MNIVISRAVLWCAFAALLLVGASALLSACDLAIRPLFGLKYCAGDATSAALARERAHGRELEAEIRATELRLAEKPVCPAPKRQEKREDKREDKRAETPEKPVEEMKLPSKIAELKGCWESVSGELPIVTDTPEKRPIGKVRTCFCFRADGGGQIKLLYTDGARCRAPIRAAIDAMTLKIEQPAFNCAFRGANRGLVAASTVCRADDAGSAACDTDTHGRNPAHVEGERYRRVEKDHCD